MRNLGHQGVVEALVEDAEEACAGMGDRRLIGRVWSGCTFAEVGNVD